jgi:hypothetical protein
MAWTALNGSTGETDFINNQGGGGGGFAFMNTPASGSAETTLVLVAGDGTVTIPTGRLLVADGNGTVMDVVAAINYLLGQFPQYGNARKVSRGSGARGSSSDVHVGLLTPLPCRSSE